MRFAVLAIFSVLLVFVPSHAVSAAENIKWPIPWHAGQVLVYESESLDSNLKPGQHKELRANDKTEIRITQESLDGYVQQWTSSDTRM